MTCALQTFDERRQWSLYEECTFCTFTAHPALSLHILHIAALFQLPAALLQHPAALLLHLAALLHILHRCCTFVALLLHSTAPPVLLLHIPALFLHTVALSPHLAALSLHLAALSLHILHLAAPSMHIVALSMHILHIAALSMHILHFYCTLLHFAAFMRQQNEQMSKEMSKWVTKWANANKMLWNFIQHIVKNTGIFCKIYGTCLNNSQINSYILYINLQEKNWHQFCQQNTVNFTLNVWNTWIYRKTG